MRRRPSHAKTLLVLALSAGMTSVGMAQENPFASGNTADNSASNPFASGGESSNSSNPFAPSGNTGNASSPFAPSFGENEAPAADTGSSTSNPFASGDTTGSQPASPFGSSTTTPSAPSSSPFGGSTSQASSSPGAVNPFASSSDSAPSAPSADTSTAGSTGASGSGIAELYQFRYVAKKRTDGEVAIIRKRMNKQEAETFDQDLKNYYNELALAGELPNFTPGSTNTSADEWAQWMAYSNQLMLWSRYCRDVVLIGSDYEFDPNTDIQWPGTPQAAETETQGGRPQAPELIINENRSLDDQAADFLPVPDTRGGGQGGQGTVIDPEQMNDVAKGIYNDFLYELRAYEEDQVMFMRDLKQSLDNRESKRLAYEDWKESRREQVHEYVLEWGRRYSGQVLTIAGVRYELYRPGNVPSQVPRGTNVVVTDFDITPYDLLNDDGTLRGPAQ